MDTTENTAGRTARPRQSTGGIVKKQTRRGTSYGIRFRAHGRRQFLHVGHEADGYTEEQAREELAYVLAQVRRGEWEPPSLAPSLREVPTFHVAASEWFEGRRIEGGRRGLGLSPSSEGALRWQLSNHLLPRFATVRIDAITVEDVDAYRRAKVREGRLGPTSINKTLNTLAAILEERGVEAGHLARNPARGRRRRLPAAQPNRTFLDRADHVAALLDAAGAMDRERPGVQWRRALLATLTLGGLRIGEALALRWRHVDLAGGRIRVPGTKTDAADRTVDLLPLLRDELAAYAAVVRRDPSGLVFATATGKAQQSTNVRRRVLGPAAEWASAAMEKEGVEPLPEGLTPHSLRRTFASILIAKGEDPAYVMTQMGHTSPNLTLALYARAMQRRDGERERLRALVDGVAAEALVEVAAANPNGQP